MLEDSAEGELGLTRIVEVIIRGAHYKRYLSDRSLFCYNQIPPRLASKFAPLVAMMPQTGQ